MPFPHSDPVCCAVKEIPLEAMGRRIRALFLLFASVGLCRCGALPVHQDHVQIIAHRGASADVPENTLAAFDAAWHQGADGIEGDFRLTRDGMVACVHDRTMERTAGDPREVAQLSRQELLGLEVGSWKHDRFRGEPVPMIDEVFAAVPAGGLILVEVKSGPETVPALISALDASGIPEEQVTVICFKDQVLRRLKDERPDSRTYLLSSFKETDGTWNPTVDALIDRALACGADGLGVHGNLEVVDKAFADRCREAGLELNVWTVDDLEDAHAFTRVGVTSITTNRPGLIRSGLR